MIAPPLPSPRIRHRLAETIVAALHESAARSRLESLGRDAHAAARWLGPGEISERAAVTDRARCASAAIATAPLRCPARALTTALESAALLFDAGLFFEVHEVLEPHWRTARAGTRDVIQGLIQIAVGYQHRVNDNAVGARALLHEGEARIRGRHLLGVSLETFAERVAATRDRPPHAFGADLIVPPFPTGWRDSP